MKNKLMVIVAGIMIAGSALADVATDNSCSVPYSGVEAFASCVEGKLYRPAPEAEVVFGYVDAEVMSDEVANEACSMGYVGAKEMYGCK